MKKLVSKLVSLIPFFVSVAFGLLIVFGLVGSLVSPTSVLPAAFLVFTVLGWAATRIVREGVSSARYLHAVLIAETADEFETDEDEKNDGLDGE